MTWTDADQRALEREAMKYTHETGRSIDGTTAIHFTRWMAERKESEINRLLETMLERSVGGVVEVESVGTSLGRMISWQELNGPGEKTMAATGGTCIEALRNATKEMVK